MLPHYDVGGDKSLRTVDAFALIKKYPQLPYKFCLYDNQWQHHDWTVEPEESWQELCVKRAWQLRNKTDWLRIWYSAGRDSYHILKLFLDHDIPIDEIIVWNNIYDEEKRTAMENFVLPSAKKMIGRRSTLVTEVRFQPSDWIKTYTPGWSHKGFGCPGGVWWCFAPFGHANMVYRRKDIFWRENRGQKCVNVVGAEKPRLRVRDGWWETYTIDVLFVDKMHDGCLDYFYLDHDFPELHAKQAWMAVNHIERHYHDQDLEWLNAYTQTHSAELYDDFCLAIGRGSSRISLTGLAQDKGYPGCPRYQDLEARLSQTFLVQYNIWSTELDALSLSHPDRFNDADARRGHIGILGAVYRLKSCSVQKKYSG